jgi:hypothetical protein
LGFASLSCPCRSKQPTAVLTCRLVVRVAPVNRHGIRIAENIKHRSTLVEVLVKCQFQIRQALQVKVATWCFVVSLAFAR